MSRIFAFPPAWPPSGAAYREQFDFDTTIFPVRDGTEFRSSQRDIPRRKVSFTTFITDSRSRANFTRFTRDHRREEPDWFPDWVRFRTITDAVEPGSVVLSTSPQGVDENPDGVDWSRPGMFSLIITPQGGVHLSEIASRSHNTIVLLDPSNEIIPAGSRIYAANPGWLDDGLTVTQRTSAVWTAQVSYQVDPAYPPLLAGYSVDNAMEWDTRVNWVAPVSVTYNKPLDILDYGFGRIAITDHNKYSERNISATYLNMNKEMSSDLLTKFLTARGRLLEFDHIMPSERAWEPVPGQVLTFPDSSLVVKGPDAFLDYQQPDDKFNTRIKVLTDMGVNPLGEVTSVEYDDELDESKLSIVWISDDPGFDIPVRNILNLGWSNKGRFSSDSLSLEYLTDTVSQYKLSLTSLPRMD